MENPKEAEEKAKGLTDTGWLLANGFGIKGPGMFHMELECGRMIVYNDGKAWSCVVTADPQTMSTDMPTAKEAVLRTVRRAVLTLRGEIAAAEDRQREMKSCEKMFSDLDAKFSSFDEAAWLEDSLMNCCPFDRFDEEM